MSQGELRDKLAIEAEQLIIFPNLQVEKMEIADAKWLTADYCEGGGKPGAFSGSCCCFSSLEVRSSLYLHESHAQHH